ncbi:hypothetical protein cand_017630 [Cryptosporidium andersoni]|uniref:Tetratricopeptide repeat family protein n=1 Tax=Cryptosporidium andersoni TaxID=117008 RepID=A0A1J4MLT8_9CRYT|nr:hypothetical protein cand_017630 [Cryptosporidium andersoni]
MQSYTEKLRNEGLSLRSWISVALYYYNINEYSICLSILQDSIVYFRLLEEINEDLGLSINDAISAIGTLCILELNMAIDCFDTNYRASENFVKQCEERLKRFSLVISNVDEYPNSSIIKCKIYRYWGYFYLFKSAILKEPDLQYKHEILNKAEVEFTRALDGQFSDIQSIVGLANVLLYKKMYLHSLRLFSIVLLLLGSEKCPNNIRIGMAYCYLKLNQIPKSLDCCRRALYINLCKSNRNITLCSIFNSDCELNMEIFTDELISSKCIDEIQEIVDILLCLLNCNLEYKKRSNIMQLIMRLNPNCPAASLFYCDSSFYIHGTNSNKNSNNVDCDKLLLRLSRRSTNNASVVFAKYQIAKRSHQSGDIRSAHSQYIYIVENLYDSQYEANSLIILASILGVIQTSCELQQWDTASQYIQKSFDIFKIHKGSLDSLKKSNVPSCFLYDFIVILVCLVITSIEDPNIIPRSVSLLAQITAEERLIICLQYLFYILDFIAKDKNEYPNQEYLNVDNGENKLDDNIVSRDNIDSHINNSNRNNRDIGKSDGIMSYLLLHKVCTALLLRGRKTLRRDDFRSKSIEWLIRDFTDYSTKVDPIPILLISIACLKKITQIAEYDNHENCTVCITNNKSTDSVVTSDTLKENSFIVLNLFPDQKCKCLIFNNLAAYYNNLGICILEAATCMAIEHSNTPNLTFLLEDSMKNLEKALKLSETSDSKEWISIIIRFNIALCFEYSGRYGNANDEYKKLTNEFPWFTAAWLRRASLALERCDFQAAAQYCELSLNVRKPDLQNSNLVWLSGTGYNPDGSNLFLAYIYNRQTRMDKSFSALSKVVKSKLSQYSNIGKVWLGYALYNKAKTQALTTYTGDFNIYNSSCIQSRLILGEVLKSETCNFIASNNILIQVAESGLIEPALNTWRHMIDVSNALQGSAPLMQYIALANLGILYSAMLTVSIQRYPPPLQHHLTLNSIIEDHGIEIKGGILGSHPHFPEQQRLFKSAIKYIQQAQTFDPCEKKLHLSMIRCCFDINLWNDARRLLELAIVRWPCDLRFRIGLSYCLERLVYSEMGDMERAKHPGRVKYWMILCEVVGSFYHWMSILKETFPIVDMKFIEQVKNNVLGIGSLQKYTPGSNKFNSNSNVSATNQENTMNIKYKLGAIPLEGIDVLPSIEHSIKQELVMSRKLYSRFEELLPIVEQVYEKEQRDVEELIIKSEDFKKKQEEENKRKEQEKLAEFERTKALSEALEKEAASIAASLADKALESVEKVRKDSDYIHDYSMYDISEVESYKDSEKSDSEKSNSEKSNSEKSNSEKSQIEDHIIKHSGKRNRKQKKYDQNNIQEQLNLEVSKDEKIKSKDKNKNKRHNKREQKKLLRLQRLREQSEVLQKELTEYPNNDVIPKHDTHQEEPVSENLNRLKKRRVESEDEATD